MVAFTCFGLYLLSVSNAWPSRSPTSATTSGFCICSRSYS